MFNDTAAPNETPAASMLMIHRASTGASDASCVVVPVVAIILQDTAETAPIMFEAHGTHDHT